MVRKPTRARRRACHQSIDWWWSVFLDSSKEIEQIVGVLSYLTSLFSENGVNIVEFLSCWTDTLFIINSADIPKTLPLLKF
ncbi:hypothetical protein HYX11_03080 [Candidatus Woesearchaeota archaeon]|nr:hypothetical protein [Candidatus Woesearchaeota archaeon]